MTTEAEQLVPTVPPPELPEPDAEASYTYEEEGYVLLHEDLASHAFYLDPELNDLDDVGADFILNRLAGYDNELERRKAAWETSQRQLKAKIDWMKRRYASALQRYAARQLLKEDHSPEALRSIELWETQKKKTVNLPCGGKLAFKKTPAALVVNNEAEFEVWVGKHVPDAFEYVAKLSKTMVNEHWKKTGEVPVGSHAKPESTAFHIQF